MNLIDIIHKLKNYDRLSSEELEQLLIWLESEQGRADLEAEIEHQWQAFAHDNGGLDYYGLLERVNRKIDERSKSKLRKLHTPKYLRYVAELAAVLIVSIGISFLWNNKTKGQQALAQQEQAPAKVEIYNPKGLRTAITLPDQSKVTLNADSKISYAQNFSAAERRVYLEGEAFFEVSSNKERPFIVHAGEASITVLGTIFNVKSYPGDSYIETTLIEGSLSVGAGDQTALLTPSEQSSIHRDSKEGNIQTVNTKTTIGWMDGKFYFQATPFSEIATVLERAFNVNISVENKLIRQKNFTGKFEHGENMEQILSTIRLSTNFSIQYQKETNTMIIK